MSYSAKLLLQITCTTLLSIVLGQPAFGKSPSCETVSYADHDLPQVLSCTQQVAKKCLSTNTEATCHRAIQLKDMYLQLLAQPQHLTGQFWRHEATCRAFAAVQPVLELPLLREKYINQPWNLTMTRICGAKTELAAAVTRFCLKNPTAEDLSALKGRYPPKAPSTSLNSICYTPIATWPDEQTEAYCSQGFNKLCWTLLFSKADVAQPVSYYDSAVSKICHNAPNNGCNETEAKQLFASGFGAAKKAAIEVEAQTKTFLTEVPAKIGGAPLLDFEKNKGAYDALLKMFAKVDPEVYRQSQSGTELQKLFKLPLWGQRVRVPIKSCEARAKSSVPSKKLARMVDVVSYDCSPHNRLRLTLTGDPEALRKAILALKDPGPNETWVNGTIVGFAPTGVVTNLIVAVETPFPGKSH